jgi:hypothetical protein
MSLMSKPNIEGVKAALQVLEDSILEATGNPEKYIEALEHVSYEVTSRLNKVRSRRPHTENGHEIIEYQPEDFVQSKECDECGAQVARFVVAIDPSAYDREGNAGDMVYLCVPCCEDPNYEWKEYCP